MSKPRWKISHKLYNGESRIEWSDEAFEVHVNDRLQAVLNQSMDNFSERNYFEPRHVDYFLKTSSGMSVITVKMLKKKFNKFIMKYEDEDVICFVTEINRSSEP